MEWNESQTYQVLIKLFKKCSSYKEFIFSLLKIGFDTLEKITNVINIDKLETDLKKENDLKKFDFKDFQEIILKEREIY